MRKNLRNRSSDHEGVIIDDVQYVFVVKQSERDRQLTVGVRTTLRISSKTKFFYALDDFAIFHASYMAKKTV